MSRWRIKLAVWIAGDPQRFAEVQAANIIVQVRKVALEEAAKLCERVAWNDIYESPEFRAGALSCAEAIRTKQDGTPVFEMYLKEKLPSTGQP